MVHNIRISNNCSPYCDISFKDCPSNQAMHPRAMQPLNKEDTWQLLTLTSSKIHQQARHKDKDLHRLTMLCNTLDRNLIEYEAIESQVDEEDVDYGQALPVTEYCEFYSSRNHSDAPPNEKEWNKVEVSESTDAEVATDSESDSGSDSDDDDEWEIAEVIDGVLPPVDEPRLQWLLTAYGDEDVCTEAEWDDCDVLRPREHALAASQDCEMSTKKADAGKDLSERGLHALTNQSCGNTATLMEHVVAAGNKLLPVPGTKELLVEQYQTLLI